MGTRRIGILTGGGDVPGLNSVIKGVVYRGSDLGFEIIGIRRGWEGLTSLNVDDPGSRTRYIVPLTRENTRAIDRTGGTVLHTSRTNPSRMRCLPSHLRAEDFPKADSIHDGKPITTWDVTRQVKKNLNVLGLEFLIAIGGDDTLSYAAHLNRESGTNIVAIPKTMDNDVRNTEYCIGFSTAITRAMDAVNRQRSTVGSHERIGIFRVFGRDAGYTALYTAYVTSTRCAIPEYEFDLEKMIDLLVTDKRNNISNYSLVILSEGAQWKGYQVHYYGAEDAYGHRKRMSVAEAFDAELRQRTTEETMVSDLTYDLRSGEADFLDKMVASTFGNMALECILQDKTGMMTAIVNGCFELMPIPDPLLGPRRVDVASMYNTERFRPNYANKLGLPIFLTLAREP